ncbi:twin-arginine translocase TatA/TatE family subunit [Blastococcus sp. Marseille-P5729]|uniref:twin-arginine translocase TatA/TatE family subunit n=1 Tax=Blastococcus sp. Marseille-P5729 TaxID=2086582 RepID=UPI000D10295D|nr:twin-arginine translocase TatA/TatE family subunit [Blastococcus sp. Marseille-P5729]
MLQNLTGWHALIILAILLLIFGSAKLPALAKGVGQSVRILRDEVHTADDTGTAAQRPQPASQSSTGQDAVSTGGDTRVPTALVPVAERRVP